MLLETYESILLLNSSSQLWKLDPKNPEPDDVSSGTTSGRTADSSPGKP
jgi:hypothetical protein